MRLRLVHGTIGRVYVSIRGRSNSRRFGAEWQKVNNALRIAAELSDRFALPDGPELNHLADSVKAAFNQRFWVYAGGLTDVQVTSSVGSQGGFQLKFTIGKKSTMHGVEIGQLS
jgi:hypothetical protein